MSNPFTAVTVSSAYNQSPPSDDGSATATNQLQWSKHKTKLTDPLKTAIESINTNSIAGFAKRLGSTISEHAVSYQILPTDQGKFFRGTATLTFTLPAVADAGEGLPLVIVNTGTGVVTIDGNASELINGDVSLALAENEAALLTTDGSEWVALVVRETVEETDTFVGTLTGMDAATTGTINYNRIGSRVTLWSDANIFGTSNTTGMTLTGLPAALYPSTSRQSMTVVRDNTTTVLARQSMSSLGVLLFDIGAFAGGGFTAAGSKGIFAGWQMNYVL